MSRSWSSTRTMARLVDLIQLRAVHAFLRGVEKFQRLRKLDVCGADGPGDLTCMRTPHHEDECSVTTPEGTVMWTVGEDDMMEWVAFNCYPTIAREEGVLWMGIDNADERVLH